MWRRQAPGCEDRTRQILELCNSLVPSSEQMEFMLFKEAKDLEDTDVKKMVLDTFVCNDHDNVFA